MIYNRFSLLLLLRLCFLFILLMGLAFTRLESKWFFSNLVMGILLVLAFIELLIFINRANLDLVRLLQALNKDDFSTYFQQSRSGRSFAKLHGTFNEVIERYKNVQIEKEAQKEFLNIAVSQLNVGIIAHEVDGRILIFNDYAQKVVGTSAANDWDILVLSKIPLIQTLHQLPIGVPAIHPHKIAAQEQNLLLQASTFTLLQKQVRLYTIKDIKTQLDQKEIESWQKVIRVLTHEIMNSLTPVISLTEMAETLLLSADNTPTNTQNIKSAISTAKDRAKGLLRFVKSYRQFLKVPQAHPSPLSLFSFVKNIQQLFGEELTKNGIEFSINLPKEDVLFMGDQYLLEQVLINMLRNAIEAVENVPNPHIHLRAMEDKKYLQFKLHDNGPGIPTEVLPNIFIPFYTTKEKGTGIGLSISRQIIQAHGGHLYVESEKGKGTTFFIVLNS